MLQPPDISETAYIIYLPKEWLPRIVGNQELALYKEEGRRDSHKQQGSLHWSSSPSWCFEPVSVDKPNKPCI